MALRRLRQAAASDAEGLPVLVDALVAGQEPIAVAAYEALNELLDRWQLLSSAASSAKLASLAHLMADQSPRARPESLRYARDLALRVLVWPVDPRCVDTPQLVCDCETVLRSAARGGAGRPSASAALRAVLPEDRNASAGAAPFLRRLSIDPPAAHFPGGGLPVELMNVPSVPRAPVDPPEGASDRAESGSPAGSMPVSRVHPASRETDSPPENARAAPPSESMAERAGENADPLPDLALIRQLASGDPRAASAAEVELQRRGYLPLHLELARRLADPDTAVRLALVDALPLVAGIDARPWLTWLARDPDARVRKAAIAVIATSSDPALRAQLRELQRQEPDPEVLRMLRGILEPRRAE